jgi:DNA mismatch repair ATPase MutS
MTARHIEYFQSLRKQAEATLNTTNKKASMVSTSRVIVFLTWIVLLTYFANERQIEVLIWSTIVFMVVFAALLKWGSQLSNSIRHMNARIKICEEENKRAYLDFSGLPSGMEFSEKHHDFAQDLDLIGEHSIFQLVNRAESPQGKSHLASWLIRNHPFDTTIKRQEAIKELKKFPDFCMAYQQQGKIVTLQKAWNISESQLSGNISLSKSLSHLWWLSMIWALLIVCIAVFKLPFSIIWGIIALNLPLLYLINKKLISKNDHFPSAEWARSLHARYLLFVDQPWESTELAGLQHNLKEGQHTAIAIKKLRLLSDLMDARGNMLYQLFNAVLLTDAWIVRAFQSWHKRHSMAFAKSVDILHKLEAYQSMAMYAFAHPGFSFPELTNEKILQFRKLGHPLIAETSRVNNDFGLQEGQIALITGSNMAGKSTFLRTVGVNMMLAYAGAPVCAESAKVGVYQLFTSMRNADSLSESVSSFFAELARIKALLEKIKTRQNVFFLVDEVLKGTNSHDRHKGAEALIKQLSSYRSMGLLSTHDLALTSLEKQIDGLLNYSFESRVEGQELVFDYKLQDGPCQYFNATVLMQKMGIDLK